MIRAAQEKSMILALPRKDPIGTFCQLQLAAAITHTPALGVATLIMT